MHTKITERVLATTPTPTVGEVFLRDLQLRGFGVRITSTGSISFFAEGRVRKKNTKRISLGRYPVLSVEDARRKAREALYKLQCGIDPVQEERNRLADAAQSTALEAALGVALQDVIDDYFKSRPIKSEAEYRAVLRLCFSDWLERPIRNITRDQIEKRYRETAFVDGRKAQAAKGMRYLNAIMTFAQGELVQGVPLIAHNPVNVLRDKKIDRTVKPRSTLVPFEKLPKFVSAVRKLKDPTARDLLMLQLLTGLRDKEAKTLLWKDVDLDARLFTVRNTKNGRDHTVPMSNAVHALLQRRALASGGCGYAFPARDCRRPIGSIRRQLTTLGKSVGLAVTHHDLRRTFASLLANVLKVDTAAIGRMLNHTPVGVTARHYIHSQPLDHLDHFEALANLVLSNQSEVEN